MSQDAERLTGYVEAWKACVDDIVALLRGLDGEDWSRPTDLAGWDVRAVATHLAHLESELAGVEQQRVAVPELEHLTAPSAIYTEGGVIARESLSPRQIIDELVESADKRYAELSAAPPQNGSGQPPITPGGIGWNWETLLRNRPLDVWMHEQDIRRAVGRPGGLNSPGAAHTARVLALAFPGRVGKKVAPPPGTTVVLDVTGVSPIHLALEIDADHRAVPVSPDPDSATVGLRMDLETFAVLGGGRRGVDDVTVEVTGDFDLAQRIVESLSVTP